MKYNSRDRRNKYKKYNNNGIIMNYIKLSVFESEWLSKKSEEISC